MIIKKAEYVISAIKYAGIPNPTLPEFMFCGRSNVGKSSFINALTNRKKLAKTSSNPGKTQTLNLFLINDSIYFVDVPGYGYANVSKQIKATFSKMIEDYICKTQQLKLAFLLVDLRHKPTQDDVTMYHFLKHFHKKVCIIATKADKVKRNDIPKNKKIILETLNPEEGDEFILTSSESKLGLDLVLNTIEQNL